jgi:hypothetical protein
VEVTSSSAAAGERDDPAMAVGRLAQVEGRGELGLEAVDES